MRARGLKLLSLLIKMLFTLVAPHAGAWVETCHAIIKNLKVKSRPMRARGLKHQL